ncbi:phosphatase PAP2 family protein [Streptomyces sp. RB6PN25]|uniref:Phosphatase PAP2 family protein n=1 Tax=Streptomyces humicola TaxID=2953240 RepID=A0ABT1Q5I2_9ACTN|nr:phosphatase PAP2 family protein [Streptomyces humicola]MCQ4084580.1 phosphatase PAP2 family protein [Streptomyces humicola]
MAELAFDGANPDTGLLYNINDVARAAPGWLDRTLVFLGQYGLIAGMALLVLWCWWRVARRQGESAPTAVAGVVWAVLAAVIALSLNGPISGLVQRPMPFVDNENLDVLLNVHGPTGYSFPSTRATLTMAVAVGLYMVNRRAGLAALGLALLEGFTRVFMGVQYPTDVAGGYALGMATTLLLAPLAMMLLVPMTKAVVRSRARFLVRSGKRLAAAGVRGEPRQRPEPSMREKDLAA